MDIAQVTKAEQQVHDEHEDDEVVGVGGGVGQMAKAPSQLLFEAQEGEQVLEEDEAGEGGEGLGVEFGGRGGGRLFPALRFWYVSWWWLPVELLSVWGTDMIHQRRSHRFLFLRVDVPIRGRRLDRTTSKWMCFSG